ncbi:DNA circularization N-terminal domain-containing protein [Acidisoma sp. 7E03]
MSGTVGAVSDLLSVPDVAGVLPGAATTLLSQLDGLLQTAAYAGVTFDMLDVREEMGRRVVKFLFPHSDAADYQDLGALQGPMTVTGLIGGADYVIRAERMRAAFLAKGPTSLLHPWLGEIQVILMRPGEIRYDMGEQGLARVQFVVERYTPPAAAATDTLGALLTKADALIDSAQLAIEQLLAPVALPLTLVASVSSFLSSTVLTWSSMITAGTGSASPTAAMTSAGVAPVAIDGDFASVCQPSLNALSAGIEAPASNADTTFADQVAALLFATPLAIAVAAQEQSAPAIGSAAGATIDTAPVLDPTQATNFLLATATLTAALGTTNAASAAGTGVPVLALASSASILAQAVSLGVSLPFVSQQDAVAWRGTLDASLAALAAQVVAIGVSQPLAANALYQALAGLRSALAADFNALIGRLPAVKTITTNKPMSAWLIALALSGDDPSSMQGTLKDIVSRNGITNPGVVPAGNLQVLQS